MDDNAYGPGLDAMSFVNDLAKGLGYEKDPSAKALNTHMQQRAAKDREMAAKIKRLFATENGAAVLEWLIASTLRRDEVPVDFLLTNTPDQVMAHALFRAGENSVVKLILQAIAQADNKRSQRRKAL